MNDYHLKRKDYLEIIKATYQDEISEFPYEKFSTKNAVVWIDPLDGTSDFVAGNLPAVTVLIGLSINGQSKAGIIHHPFSLEDN